MKCSLLLLPRVRPISLGRRLRLRGPQGAQDVFGLAAIAQNLRWLIAGCSDTTARLSL
jgi:hypothetical protein